MISKQEFKDIFKRTRTFIRDECCGTRHHEHIVAQFYEYICNGDEFTLISEIEKERFRTIVTQYKSTDGTAEECYRQHKKLITDDIDKQIVFLQVYRLTNIEELNKKETYPEEFYDESLRTEILTEQKNKCALCGENISFSWPHLHHIDYNKQNCEKDNFAFLCCRCHGKTGFNRSFWTKYFKENHNK